MSERSNYLRDEADKCRQHAIAVTDVYIQAELRRLAVEYIERAAAIEEAKIAAEAAAAEPSPPSLWRVDRPPQGKPDR
jgi:hypothetical protein